MKYLNKQSIGHFLLILLTAVLSACSPSDEPSVKAKAVAENPKPTMPKEAKAVTAAHAPAPAAQTITIQINNPQPAFSEEDKARLKQDVETLAVPLKEVIEEYDRNLDNPEQKRRLEGKMQAGVDAYNQKVLSLIKEELKQNPVPAQ